MENDYDVIFGYNQKEAKDQQSNNQEEQPRNNIDGQWNRMNVNIVVWVWYFDIDNDILCKLMFGPPYLTAG